MKSVHVIAWILLVIGGLNWLLVGINPAYDIVAMIGGGQMGILAKIIYILVGISALVSIFTHKRDCKCCESGPAKVM